MSDQSHCIYIKSKSAYVSLNGKIARGHRVIYHYKKLHSFDLNGLENETPLSMQGTDNRNALF